GGTMILNINNYVDAVNIEAAGGKGGIEDDDGTSQRCYGDGGGGSGGAIYFKTTTPSGTVSVAGGLKGDRINSLNCGTIIASTNGTTGSVFNSYSFIQSTTLSTACAGFPLPVQMIYFKAFALPRAAALEWELANLTDVNRIIIERKDAGNWKEIKTIINSNTSPQFSYRDLNLEKGQYQYRLNIIENN